MIDVIKPLIKQFLPFAQERMGFDKPPRLFVRRDEQNAQNPLGKTAYYDPSAHSVTLYITGRHPKDVMRSLSHELVHHTQNCNGEFDNVGEMGDGYAQNDAHLREMERQAYEIGNLCFRDWEDSIKHTIYFEHLQKGVEKVMSTKNWKNGELKSLLSEAWGFKMDLSKLNEEYTGSGDDHMGDDTTEAEEETKGENDPVTEGELDEMGGCADHGPEDEVVVMQSADEEGPDDPNAIVDELGDLVARLSAALGGAMGPEGEEEEMVVDVDMMQERIKKALKKALKETGAKKTGSSKDDDSKTHPGEEDYTTKKGEKLKHSGKGRGEKEGDEAYINEDSGEEEGMHYKDDAEHDDKRLDDMRDLVRKLEDHIRALEGDRDYDDEHIEERRGRGRNGPSIRGPADPRLREAIRKALKASIVKKKK
tara:strand:- start:8296 stop:9561 length:1266 start_codon:yes stop_codon:yes gene_type:complete